MFGVAVLYLVAMAYVVWWYLGVRAHRRDQRPPTALIVPGFAARFPGAALTWTADDDRSVAQYLDDTHPR